MRARIGKVLGVLCCISILLYISVYCLGDNMTTDYGQYLRKIWVVEGWHGGENRYNACFSFMITKIDDGVIEGWYFVSGYVAPYKVRKKFVGQVKENSAKCDLYKDSQNVGMLELKFLGENKVEGDIIYHENETIVKNYMFRPYTLYDVNDLYIEPYAHLAFRTVEIDTWGEVNLVAGIIDGYKSYPAVFMTDASDNILFRFESGYQTASEIYDVSVDDYDGDGLDDVRIVNYFPYEEDSVYIDRTFYQTEKGLFEEKR